MGVVSLVNFYAIYIETGQIQMKKRKENLNPLYKKICVVLSVILF